MSTTGCTKSQDTAQDKRDNEEFVPVCSTCNKHSKNPCSGEPLSAGMGDYRCRQYSEVAYFEHPDLALAALMKEHDEMAYHFACALEHATGGRMSKTGYSKEAMFAQIDDFVQEQIEEAVKERLEDAKPIEPPPTDDLAEWLCDRFRHEGYWSRASESTKAVYRTDAMKLREWLKAQTIRTELNELRRTAAEFVAIGRDLGQGDCTEALDTLQLVYEAATYATGIATAGAGVPDALHWHRERWKPAFVKMREVLAKAGRI